MSDLLQRRDVSWTGLIPLPGLSPLADFVVGTTFQEIADGEPARSAAAARAYELAEIRKKRAAAVAERERKEKLARAIDKLRPQKAVDRLDPQSP